MKQNSIIYQIFPRNYSQNGTFKDIENDLPRIKELGIDIIYLMPIHEIGEKNRKGTYGSPYACKDYFSISSDLGTKEDLVSLINKTHELGMEIILDMVFNHTSPDNVLLEEHEDYYFHRGGHLSNRVGEWSDIVDLNTYKKETQQYLLTVLKYWASLGIDGFRFDVASMIPISFFQLARKKLGNKIIFIGESVDKDFANYLRDSGDYVTLDSDMYPTFDSLYNYNYYRIFTKYLRGYVDIDQLVNEFNADKDHLRLHCLENHDNDRIASLLRKDEIACYLDFFSFIKGQFFIYAGQEYGIQHKPLLFEKDPVDFSYKDEEIYSFYKELIDIKHQQKDIIDMHFDKIDDNHMKVWVKYFDNTEEIREFYFPQNL